MNPIKLTPLIALVLLAGCETPKQEVRPQTTRNFNYPLDAVWTASVGVLTELYPLQIIEKASGILETRTVAMGPEIFKYGSHPSLLLGIWNQGRVTLSLYVHSIDANTTSVRIIPILEGYESNVATAWYRLQSNGMLEDAILAKIEQNVTAAAKK